MQDLKIKQSPSPNPKVKFLIPVLLIFFFTLQALTSILWKSTTVEEGVHLAAGAYYWKTFDFEPFPAFSPVFRMWATLPLEISGVNIPDGKPGPDEICPFGYGADFLYIANDADSVLFIGRAMVVLLAVLLGYYIFRFSYDVFSWHAAVLALFIYVLSPNILAHARLVTPDLPLAAFIFITFYYFRKAAVTGRYHFALLSSFFAFLAINTKHTGLLLFPALLLYVLSIYAIEKQPWLRRKTALPLDDRMQGGSVLKNFTVVLIFSVILLNASYGFKGTLKSLKNYHDNVSQKNGRVESTLFKKFAEIPMVSSIPIPFPHLYLRGLDLAVYYDMDAPHPNWYLGNLYPGKARWWHYYLTALALKVPVPMLITIVMIFISCLVAMKRGRIRWELFIFLLIPPALFFFFYSFICHSQLGLRLILPAFPFIFVSTGFLVPTSLKKQQRPVMIMAGVLMILYFLSSARIYPHYLSYFNEFAGGPTKGIAFFADSNIDWGQDLKGLKRYMDMNGLKKINLVYYGPYDIPELNYYDIQINNPNLDKRVPWAVSATWRYYADMEPFKSTIPFPLRKQPPDDRIGYSIYLYFP